MNTELPGRMVCAMTEAIVAFRSAFFVTRMLAAISLSPVATADTWPRCRTRTPASCSASMSR